MAPIALLIFPAVVAEATNCSVTNIRLNPTFSAQPMFVATGAHVQIFEKVRAPFAIDLSTLGTCKRYIAACAKTYSAAETLRRTLTLVAKTMIAAATLKCSH